MRRLGNRGGGRAFGGGVLIRDMEPVTPENLVRLSRFLADSGSHFADFTAGYQSMWAADYDCRFGRLFGVRALSAREADGSRRYALVDRLTDSDAKRFFSEALPLADGAFTLGALTEEEALRYAALYGGESRVAFFPEEADYLYEALSLQSLAGRRLAAKRNHLNAFLRDYPDYEILPYTEETQGEALAFLREFRLSEEDTTPSAHAEGTAAERLLSLCPPALLYGILLRVGGETVGISVGELRRDCFYMHVEKARRSYRGAYPLLVREACRRLPDTVLYANREEDDGDAGLRQSKLSYAPIAVLPKYTLTLFPK